MRIQRSAVTPPKIVKTEPPPAETKEVERAIAVVEGDRIEYSVTHEINAEGEKAWVKYGVNAGIGPGETAEAATARITAFVNNVVMSAAETVAKQILQA